MATTNTPTAISYYDAIAGLRAGTLHYTPIAESQIPDGVRFDVPGDCQGQTIEVAYGGFSRTEHGEGAPYRRVHDQSLPHAITYYVLAPVTVVVPAAADAWTAYLRARGY